MKMGNLNGEFENEVEAWNNLPMQEKERIYKEDVEQLRKDFNLVEGGNGQAISDWTEKYGRRGYKSGTDGVINIPARDIIRGWNKQYSFEENDFNERKQTYNPNYNRQKVQPTPNNLSMNANSQNNIVNRQQTEQNQEKSRNNDLSKIPQDIFAGVPIGPNKKEILIKSNIEGAKRLKSMWSREPAETLWTFIQFVKSNGIWDYKTQNPDFQDFGNFNYGVVGAAAGFDEKFLLVAAGAYQQIGNTRKFGEGIPFIKPPYGDEPKDQEQIRKGIEWYKKNKNFFE
jgi:hypothetical protein